MKLELIFGCLLASGVATAQFGRSGVWMTAGSNAQRSSWIRTDASISKDKLTPDFQFLWKVQLDKPGTGSPSQPIIMDQYIGYRGFRSLAFMGSVDGGVYAVDTDLNRIEWQKHIASSNQVKSSANCAGSLVAGVTLPSGIEFPVLGITGNGGARRGSFATSGVGEPFEGAVTLAAVRRMPTPPPPVTPRPAAVAAPRHEREPIVLYTVTSDGMFHALYVSNGEESGSPVQLVPSASVVRGLIVANHFAYAVVREGCAAADQVVALNLSTKEILSWASEGAIAGSEGAAIGADGTLYVATGKGSSTYASSVVALDPQTMKPKDWYTVPGLDFTSTPVVFLYRNRVLVAATTRDGRMHVLDAKSLGGADHQSALAVSDKGDIADFEPNAIAKYQDSKLNHWLAASSGHAKDGSLISWELADGENGAVTLQRGWTMPNLNAASSPIVINGVLFTASNSRFESGRKSAPSVLYAIDAVTGKELWSSKKTITASAVSLSAGAGHVYVTTNDGSLYAFGFPMEH